MKVFKFPHSSPVDSLKNGKSNSKQLSKSPKFSQEKRPSSLDFSYFQAKKLKELEKVYRTNSADKKTRNKSISSSKSNSQLKTNFKPSPSAVLSTKKQFFHPEKKIFLRTEKSEKKSKFSFNDLKSVLELMNQKLHKCLQARSQKLFLEEYADFSKIQEKIETKQNNTDLVIFLVKNIQKCEQKKVQRKTLSLSEKIKLLQKQKSSQSIQLKKSKIKQELQIEEMKKIADRNLQLQNQIKKMRQKVVSSIQTQTQNIQNNELPETNTSGQADGQGPKLIQQIRILRQRQNHMNILISQLKREGINLQKIYRKGIKVRQRAQAKSNNEQVQSSSESEYLCSESNQQNSQNYRKPLPKYNHSQCDADDSIIDQMDAISFNWQDKQAEMQVYTPRNIYVNHKVMNEDLRKKLNLNFDILNEEQNSGSQAGGSQAFPTI